MEIPLSKAFEYHSSDPTVPYGRIMWRITDEEGRRTEYLIDSATGNRTRERVYSAGNSLVRQTNFEYHPNFKAFMTKRETVNGLLGPGGSSNLVELFVPDQFGNLEEEIKGDRTSMFDGQVTRYAYDLAGNRTLATDGVGNSTHYVYDDAGRLITTLVLTENDETVAVTQYGYDFRGNKTSETDANNHTTNFFYDGMNRLEKKEQVLETSILITEHTYNNLGSKLTTKDPNGNLTEWTFDPLQRPVTMVQKPDAATSYLTQYFYERERNCGSNSFDTSAFKATSVIHPKIISTPSGPVRYARAILEFDSLYREIKSSQEYAPDEWAVTKKKYDLVGNPIQITDPAGLVTTFQYDAENRLLKTIWPTAPFGPVSIQKTWTPAGLAINETNERGAITTYAYDKAGRLSHTWAPNPATGAFNAASSPLVRNFYNRAGNLVKMVNPLGAEWDYFYDALNRRYKELRPAAIDSDQASFPMVRSESLTHYDPVGNVVDTVDARGNITKNYYDYANRLVEVHQPLAAVYGVGPLEYGITKTTYDANGNALEVTDPLGNKTVNTYDGLNRLTSTRIWSTRPGGTTPAVEILSEFTYDAAGNRISITDGEGQQTVFHYDGLNRLTETRFDVGTTFATTITEMWGPLNKISRTEPGGRITRYTYDFRHRLKEVRYNGVSAHAENRLYSYDAVGNQLSVVHPYAPDTLADTATTWDYLNRAQTETSAGCVHHYTYDKAGNRTHTVYDGGRQLECTYDALNRLATCTESHPSTGEPSRVSQYLYDRDGNTRFKQLPGGTVETRTWDSRGRATAQRTNMPGSLAWPPASGTPGAIITEQIYHYDNTGNVREIVEHTRAGGNAALALPDRVVTNTYDDAYRLIEEKVLTYTTPSRVEKTQYTYDRAGNRRTKECDFGPPEENGITYCEYDGAANQVTKFLRADGSRVFYAYNVYGCRSHRWVVAAGVPDPIVTPPLNADTFQWDRENRLIHSIIQQPAPPEVPRQTGLYTFNYDARTRRVGRQTPGQNTRVSFSGGLSVQEYTDATGGSGSGGTGSGGTGSGGTGFGSEGIGSGSSSPSIDGPSVEYVRGSDYGGGVGGILYSIRKTIGAGGGIVRTASCNHYNSRGDVITKSEATTGAAVLWTAAYQAFGTRPEEKGTNPDPQRANTKEEDGTGLLNEGYRYRCLETGMFVSRDPAGFVDGPNLYSYVLQNPWSNFDPKGLNIEFTYQKTGITERDYTISKAKVTINAALMVIGEDPRFKTQKYLDIAKNRIEQGVAKTFSKEVIDVENKERIQMDVKMNITVVQSAQEVQDRTFVGLFDGVGGVTPPGDDTILLGGKALFTDIAGQRMSAHETGHLLGIKHPHPSEIDPNNPVKLKPGEGMDDTNTLRGIKTNNVMSYQGVDTVVENTQMLDIYKRLKAKTANESTIGRKKVFTEGDVKRHKDFVKPPANTREQKQPKP
jgi:RHS repeat-associated protein